MLSRSEKYVCFSASETFHFTCGRMFFEVSYYRGKKPEGCPKHISSLDFFSIQRQTSTLVNKRNCFSYQILF